MRKFYSFLFFLSLAVFTNATFAQKRQAIQMITEGNKSYCKVAHIEESSSPKQAEFGAENLEIIWHKQEFGAVGQHVYYSKLSDKSFVNWYLNDQRVSQYAYINTPVWEVPTTAGFPQAFSNKSGSIYILVDANDLYVLDPLDGSEIWHKNFPKPVSYAAAFPDGSGFYCSVGEYPEEYSVYAFLTNSQTPIWSLPAENGVVGISVPENHSEVLVCLAQPAQKVMVVNPANGEVKQELYYYNNSPSQSPAFSANGEYMVLADFSGKGTLYKRNNGKYEMQWQASLQSTGTTSVWGCGQSISADGSTIAFGTLDFYSSGFSGSIYVYNNYSNEPLWALHNCGDEVAQISITEDGSLIAAASWGPIGNATPDLFIFRKESAEPVGTLNTSGSLFYIDLAPDGSRGIVAGKAAHAREMGSGGNTYFFNPVPTTYGNIGGMVTLPNSPDNSFALLSLESLDNYYAFSNAEGDYAIKYIPSGSYNLKASKQGYYSKIIENVVVTGENTTIVDIELEPAGAAVTHLFASQGAYPTVHLTWSSYSGSHSGFNIYRKRSDAAPFTEIFATVGAGVTEFIDNTALPTIDYYYGVTAQINADLESPFSNVALGNVSTSFITREIDIYNTTVVPTIDGVISAGEWDDAFVFDASDFLGSDGKFEPVGSVIIYVKADANNLYVAVENKNDTQLSAGDRTAFYIDDNNNGHFEEPGNDSEGNYWIDYGPAGTYRMQYRPIYSNGGVGTAMDIEPRVAASDATGYVVAEFILPMGTENHEIKPGPGNKSKAYIYVRDGAFGGQDGQWPFDNPETFVPIGYGTMNFFITASIPPPPMNLRYTPHYFNSPEFVAISWDLPNINNLSHFKITIKNVNTGTFEHFETEGNQIIYEVEDLTTYEVTAITVNKLGQESVPSNVLEIVTNFNGIIPLEKNNFKVYPNPTNGSLTIDHGPLPIKVVQIFDISGKNVYSNSLSHHSNITTIDISSFHPGIYFIKVGDGVQKFIKY